MREPAASGPGPRPEDVSALMRVLEERWVFCLSLSEPDSAPYPCPLYYALEPGAEGARGPSLLFASSPNSHHGHLIGASPEGVAAAGGLYLESETIGELRGAQLRGWVRVSDHPADRALYLKRHPVAKATLEGKHKLYRFDLVWAKLTDNRLGFGAHPTWHWPRAR